ncbi:uncharacterized protein N7525_007421 [Penicillium rubens]|uniref:uncharacterized protein n=1 Tax=Penicillium rubens TaxID=1108849 RepID=UPI002A5A732C|nr:uncharacterized protein N7525_007421 [Penicillium rubens]KAJ5829168.1 hypothetical protein N7525_007421 [Penicillium rubens]
MSDSQWLWDPLISVKWSRLGKLRPVVALPRKEISCKLIVKNETLKEGCHKLNNLARGPFVPSTLDSQLSDLVSFVLCKQWHRERQHNDVKQRRFDAAVRNQADVQESPRQLFPQIIAEEIDGPQQEPASTALEPDEFAPIWGVDAAFPRLPASTWLEVSRPPGGDVTPGMLTMNRAPWDVSPDDPAILSIHNEYGGLHSLQIDTVRQESCSDGTVDVMDRSALSYARRPLKMLPASRQQKDLSMPQTH